MITKKKWTRLPISWADKHWRYSRKTSVLWVLQHFSVLNTLLTHWCISWAAVLYGRKNQCWHIRHESGSASENTPKTNISRARHIPSYCSWQSAIWNGCPWSLDRPWEACGPSQRWVSSRNTNEPQPDLIHQLRTWREKGTNGYCLTLQVLTFIWSIAGYTALIHWLKEVWSEEMFSWLRMYKLGVTA